MCVFGRFLLLVENRIYTVNITGPILTKTYMILPAAEDHVFIGDIDIILRYKLYTEKLLCWTIERCTKLIEPKMNKKIFVPQN